MNNSYSTIINFNDQYTRLINNLNMEIGKIEGGSKLNNIISQVDLMKIIGELKISDEESKHLSLLTAEMEFLNCEYKRQNESKQLQNKWQSKWLEATSVVLESIGNYMNIPLFDIVIEVVRIASIIK
jgi:hypothetical protein